jgi:hypothetical protein
MHCSEDFSAVIRQKTAVKAGARPEKELTGVVILSIIIEYPFTGPESNSDRGVR